jgi:hypothetical protein
MEKRSITDGWLEDSKKHVGGGEGEVWDLYSNSCFHARRDPKFQLKGYITRLIVWAHAI